MARIVLLDSGPLGLASHPRPSPDIAAWILDLVRASVTVLVPEIADFEVRRELLRANRRIGVARLDVLKSELGYLPITTAAMLQAAEFWAQARQRGRPTAPDLALDADTILAGQAAMAGDPGDDVTVATINVGHLARFVDARSWQTIRP